MRHIVTKKSRGFGFVNYFTPRGGENAIKEMHKKVLIKNKIHVYPSTYSSKVPKEGNLYISNISKATSRETLENELEQFGPIYCLKFIDDESDSRNQAFVQFENIPDAENALENMHLKKIDEQAISVEIASKNYTVYIRGKQPEGVELKPELLKYFHDQGDVTIGEVQFNKSNREFFTSARLSTEEKALAFVKYCKKNKDKFPMIQDVSDFTNKKPLLKKFKENQKDNLFCSISPVSPDIDVNVIR